MISVQGKRVRNKVERAKFAEHKYCSNFLIQLEQKVETSVLKDELKTKGSALIVLDRQGWIRVHIHTNEPEQIEEFLSGFGQISNKRIEEMW